MINIIRMFAWPFIKSLFGGLKSPKILLYIVLAVVSFFGYHKIKDFLFDEKKELKQEVKVLHDRISKQEQSITELVQLNKDNSEQFKRFMLNYELNEKINKELLNKIDVAKENTHDTLKIIQASTNECMRAEFSDALFDSLQQ